VKQRHNNQDRVVAPEADARLRQIAEACARSGLPEAFCDILAEGYVFRLRRRAWAQLDDRVGTGDDVEALCGWKGPPRALAKALERAGYVQDQKGVLIAVDAIAEAPEYIKARWRRRDKASYDAAAERAAQQVPNVVHPRWPQPEEDTEDAMPPDTLFGPVPDVPGDNANGQSIHAKFSRRWAERYRAVEGRSYTWGRKSDERFIKWITDTLESWTECERVIDAYLADRRPFFARHELRKLYANLADFRQRAKPRAGASSGSQADTATVTIRVGSVPKAGSGAETARPEPTP
jgi:hypothetical protein